MSSAVLQALKTVDEKIKGNYTSGQLFEVLDKMMYRAIEPLIINTKYIDRCLSIICAWYAQNHRRKISPHNKKRLTAYIVAFLAESNPKKRCALYRKMRLERNITFFLVRHWLSIIEPWKGLHIKRCRGEVSRQEEQQLLLQCCVVEPSSLWGTISDTGYWLEQANLFKGYMSEKYMRLVMLEAHTHWTVQKEKNPHLELNLEELAQNFMLAVLKAIDKFDVRQGTLTSYVQDWFRNARISQTFRGEYGIAYTIPHSKKTSIAKKERGSDLTRNLSVSIDSEEALQVADERDIEHQIISRQESKRIREVAKYSDSFGIGRLLLGIQETLSADELRALLAASADQLPQGTPCTLSSKDQTAVAKQALPLP